MDSEEKTQKEVQRKEIDEVESNRMMKVLFKKDKRRS